MFLKRPALCAGVRPLTDRSSMRLLVDRIPLEGVCVECEMEFWRNLGFFDLFGQPTKH
jgi:hypothetical protein